MTMRENLKKLAEIYPWPDRKPKVEPDPHGWLNDPTKQMLAGHLDASTKVVVELGSWLGLSSRHILSQAPNTTLICVDHWRGSKYSNALQDKTMQGRLSVLYETFQVNMWEVRHRVIPLRSDSWRGLEIVYEHAIEPDLIYIDASHEYPDVFKDVETAVDLFPGSLICGDDWGFPGVRRAVLEIAKSRGREVMTHHRWAWEFRKE